MLEEIVETPETSTQRAVTNRYGNALLQIVPAYVLVSSGRWADLWPLFGGANQLLAALALLTATVWIANWDESKQLVSTGVPMALMSAVTILALLYLAIVQNFVNKFLDPEWMADATITAMASAAVQIVISLVLVGLAVSLVRIGYGNIRAARGDSAVAADGGEPSDD